MKLLFDLSLAKAELEKERQLRVQIEQQLTETNLITEQVKLPCDDETIGHVGRSALLVDQSEEEGREK